MGGNKKTGREKRGEKMDNFSSVLPTMHVVTKEVYLTHNLFSC